MLPAVALEALARYHSATEKLFVPTFGKFV